MAIKAVEMVRKIRDKHYDETKDLPVLEQIQVVRELSGKLAKQMKRGQRVAESKAAPVKKERVVR